MIHVFLVFANEELKMICNGGENCSQLISHICPCPHWLESHGDGSRGKVCRVVGEGVRIAAILLLVALREVCGGDMTHSLVVAEDSFSSGVSV